MVTLCPAGSTQPVADSGEAALGAAATQIVCDIRLTKVTRRWSAAPVGGGPEAAESVGESGGTVLAGDPCLRVTPASGDTVLAPGTVLAAGTVVPSRASVGDAELDGPAAGAAVAVAASPGEPAPAAAVAAGGTAAAPLPSPAQPAVNVTAVTATTTSAACAARANARRVPPASSLRS